MDDRRKALEALEKGHLIELLIRATDRLRDAEREVRLSFEDGSELGKDLARVRHRAMIADELETAGFSSAACFLRGQ